MQVRRIEDGTLEGRCSRGEWRALNETNFYRSTLARRNPGAINFYVSEYSNRGETNEYAALCRSCEADRQRARRSDPNRATRRRSGRGRIFGVELELTGPSAATVIAGLEAAGIALDPRNVASRHELGYSATNTNAHVWTLKHDGSVRGFGLELVSPKLRGDAGLVELRSVCYALQSVGATVDSSTGVHVHIDFRTMELDAIRRQLMVVLRNQDHMMAMVAPSRRTNASYVPQWTAAQIDALAAHETRLESFYGPRGTVNVGAYSRHGSVEFRAHGGSTNFAKLGAWVRFLMAALEHGATNTAVHFDSMTDFFMAIGTSVEDQRHLTRFVRAAEALEVAEYADDAEMAVSA